MVPVGIDSMSDLIGQIGLALEAFKGRQQDIIGLGHRAYKDLFAAANSAMLTSVVQSLIQQSYAEMITANPPRTSLLAAVSQQHTEIMAGFRVLTEDDGLLRALVDAANASTAEAFRMIYAETPKTAADSGAPKRKSAVALVQPPVKTNRRSTKKTGAKKTLE
jgi:hypothetical protein